jgi:hypothetical protein
MMISIADVDSIGLSDLLQRRIRELLWAMSLEDRAISFKMTWNQN